MGAFVMVADSLSLSRKLGGASMQEYSIVQGQSVMELLFALLSVLIASYVFSSWRARAQPMDEPESKPAAEGGNMLLPTTAPLNANPRSPSPTRPNTSPTSDRRWWATHRASIGDWLAPILVWSVVGWSALAVIIILLGEN